MNIEITQADCEGQSNPVAQAIRRAIPTRPLAILGNKARIGKVDVPLPEWVCVKITNWRAFEGKRPMKPFSFPLDYEIAGAK